MTHQSSPIFNALVSSSKTCVFHVSLFKNLNWSQSPYIVCYCWNDFSLKLSSWHLSHMWLFFTPVLATSSRCGLRPIQLDGIPLNITHGVSWDQFLSDGANPTGHPTLNQHWIKLDSTSHTVACADDHRLQRTERLYTVMDTPNGPWKTQLKGVLSNHLVFSLFAKRRLLAGTWRWNDVVRT